MAFVSGMPPRPAALAPSGRLFLFSRSVPPCASCHPPCCPSLLAPARPGVTVLWVQTDVHKECDLLEFHLLAEVVAGDDLSVHVAESMGGAFAGPNSKASPLPGLERIQRCLRQCHEPSSVSRASQQSPIAKNRNMGKADRAYSSFLALDTYCVCTTYVQHNIMYKSLGQQMPERSSTAGLPFPTPTEQGRGFSIWDAGGLLAGCWRARRAAQPDRQVT